ncbi:MAG: outer membrane lipoprotein carrier protein LolA [Ekhidna sp.]|nr:outer membrane lipoprotein carrier protein LolA [Ekhidna sp.]MBC6409905.1 outer membrane lipoprotein carrier protein LolA [Ekhidna sp.]MBC6425515.1 outer membrane lipoprotein carrier protein LolA [Ekhidna sp.]
MKKIIIILLAVVNQSILAQYDPQALSVLDAMSAKYKKLAAFKANFSQKLTNKTAGIDEVISGQIIVKNNKYVLNVAGQRIFNNGTDIYTYNPEISEVTISSYDPDESEINPGNVYDLYKEGFKYALISTESSGDRVIDLDPEKRDKSYFKIRMIINAKDELKSFEVFENTGNRYLYSIESFQPDLLPDSYFTFDTTKYPDVEVIDFR